MKVSYHSRGWGGGIFRFYLDFLDENEKNGESYVYMTKVSFSFTIKAGIWRNVLTLPHLTFYCRASLEGSWISCAGALR